MQGHPAFVFVLAMALGVTAQVLARHLRVPGIVLLLIAGAGLGPDGLGWVQPRALGEGLFSIVHLAVAVILFEGGLNLEISRLRREQAAIRRLVFLGALITLLGAALSVHALFDVSIMTSLLFGSLVVVTGPTVIGPLVRDLRLRPRLATVLEAEGVLIDPIGVILAVLMLEIALAPGTGSLEQIAEVSVFSSGAYQLFLRLSFGVAAGAIGGFAISGLLRVRRLVPEGLENVMVLSFVLLLFQGCEEVVSESGIMAVAIAGVVVGNLRTQFDRDLREFKDQLSVLLVGMLFVLLAADVRLEEVLELGWRGAAVVAVLVFAVRPLGVWLCTRNSELSTRERWFVAWVAPRGIVAAAVASVTASALESAGMPWGTELRALVFLTIAGTVVLAGVTAGPVASLLKVRMPGRDTVAILGAQGLGLALARELEAAGRPVIFLDSNPQNCRLAEEAGFPVVFGNALQERTLQRARFEGVGMAIGMSANQMLNSVFATRSNELFSVPRAYIAVVRPDLGLAPDLVASERARILFDGPHDIERWDVRSRHGDLEVDYWIYEGPPELAEGEEPLPLHDPGELYVMFCVRRGRQAYPMHRNFVLTPDDIVAVALHGPDRERAEALLRERGFVPAPVAEAKPEA